MSASESYFGTDGIRGKVGEYPITPSFVLQLGYAIGMMLQQQHITNRPAVIIAKDTRLSGYLFESALEAGLTYSGTDVYMAGPLPTAAVAYLTKALRLDLGIVISASHNSYLDNGFKFFSQNGNKLDHEHEHKINQLLDKAMIMATKLGKVWRLDDARGRYIEFCKNTFPANLSLSGLTIVVDCAHGATYQVATMIFSELGANVIAIGCQPDGININENCGSLFPDAMIAQVIANNADFGIAFDGDGDRVVIADQQGRLFNGDKIVYIIMQLYRASGKNVDGIVGTVMTNLAMEHALLKHSCQLIRAAVGDRNIVRELIERNWLIGGEASGHVLCLDKHATGDGIITSLQVLAAFFVLKKPLNTIVDWDEFPQVTLNVKNPVKHWQQEAQDSIQVAQEELRHIGRVIVRSSGTESVVRITVESTSIITAKFWAESIAKTISASQPVVI